MILPLFPYMTIFLLVLHYDSGKQIARGGWSGFGKALSGIDPTGFGLYPTSIPTGVIVQKCLIIVSSDIIYDDISPIPMTAPSKWRPVTAESANAGA